MNFNLKNSGENSNGTGRLIGWLVSYGLADKGAAFEIRAGRTFVGSGEGGAARTVIIQDESISAPHLALNASPKHKVLVQDIFSEEGSFLRKSGAPEESRITGPVYVEHGDWIRIGNNTRFQVCLVDGPSR